MIPGKIFRSTAVIHSVAPLYQKAHFTPLNHARRLTVTSDPVCVVGNFSFPMKEIPVGIRAELFFLLARNVMWRCGEQGLKISRQRTRNFTERNFHIAANFRRKFAPIRQHDDCG